jgi:hypothetical protein
MTFVRMFLYYFHLRHIKSLTNIGILRVYLLIFRVKQLYSFVYTGVPELARQPLIKMSKV